MEGLLMGAIIGGQAGPIGAAVGGVTMLVYGAITGSTPFGGGAGGGGAYPYPGSPQQTSREAELEAQIEQEVARQDSLESEIEAELRRQEELLRTIEQGDALREVEEQEASVTKTHEEIATLADPRAAPQAPELRSLPESIFDEERRTVPAGKWGDSQPRDVVVRSLDADRDGAAEEVRYLDPATGAMVRKENDEDYDGKVDAWTTYDAGIVSAVDRDTNADGRPDEFERYGRDGRMASRDVDRNHDGRNDASYVFQQGSLVEERHDSNNNGTIDRTLHYENRKLVRVEEDTDGSGRIDTWTHYRTEGSREVEERVERDTSGDGRPDTFETYEHVAGKPVLKQRNEDKNGDGEIDIKSYYEGGKLKSREISDPALLPL